MPTGNPWGWFDTTASNVFYYPTTFTASGSSAVDVTNLRVSAPAPKEPASVVEWLRRQIEEVTALAVA